MVSPFPRDFIFTCGAPSVVSREKAFICHAPERDRRASVSSAPHVSLSLVCHVSLKGYFPPRSWKLRRRKEPDRHPLPARIRAHLLLINLERRLREKEIEGERERERERRVERAQAGAPQVIDRHETRRQAEAGADVEGFEVSVVRHLGGAQRGRSKPLGRTGWSKRLLQEVSPSLSLRASERLHTHRTPSRLLRTPALHDGRSLRHSRLDAAAVAIEGQNLALRHEPRVRVSIISRAPRRCREPPAASCISTPFAGAAAQCGEIFPR